MPVLKRVDGVDRWFVGEHNFGSTGGNVVRPDNKKLLGRLAFPTLEEGHPGAYNTKARVAAMDDMGIHAHLIYQNSGVTQIPALMALGDPELSLEVVKIFNDAGAERQIESKQRLFTMSMLPVWNQKEMEAEARRCIDMNVKGFNLPDTPERWGIPSYMDDYWTPFLEMCEATGTPINFHLNGGIDPMTMTWKGFKFEQTPRRCSRSATAPPWATGSSAAASIAIPS
jgi:predicted TIM-barrel fold metal-dependent hydrolase